ncbi:MAG TPA: hypothetical protein VGE58_07690 [Daejeonella sp.]
MDAQLLSIVLLVTAVIGLISDLGGAFNTLKAYSKAEPIVKIVFSIFLFIGIVGLICTSDIFKSKQNAPKIAVQHDTIFIDPLYNHESVEQLSEATRTLKTAINHFELMNTYTAPMSPIIQSIEPNNANGNLNITLTANTIPPPSMNGDKGNTSSEERILMQVPKGLYKGSFTNPDSGEPWEIFLCFNGRTEPSTLELRRKGEFQQRVFTMRQKWNDLYIIVSDVLDYKMRSGTPCRDMKLFLTCNNNSLHGNWTATNCSAGGYIEVSKIEVKSEWDDL